MRTFWSVSAISFLKVDNNKEIHNNIIFISAGRLDPSRAPLFYFYLRAFGSGILHPFSLVRDCLCASPPPVSRRQLELERISLAVHGGPSTAALEGRCLGARVPALGNGGGVARGLAQTPLKGRAGQNGLC